MLFGREHRWKENKEEFSSRCDFYFVSCGGVCPCVSHLFPHFDTVYNGALLVVIEGDKD